MKRVVLLFFSVVFLKNKLISEIQDKNNNNFIDTHYTSRLLNIPVKNKNQTSLIFLVHSFHYQDKNILNIRAKT